jgi:hypothetical protein
MGIDPMNNISIIIRILFAVTLFQQGVYHLEIRIISKFSVGLLSLLEHFFWPDGQRHFSTRLLNHKLKYL